jgi:hypothetical protein
MAKYANENIKGDGLIATNVDEMYVGRDTQYVAFKLEQIYILGNKQDVEGFKKFVGDTKLQLDIQNINVTFDVVNHFYEQSGKRQSFEAYAKTFVDMAAQLKTTGMTNQEIIEKLKCL